MPWPKRSRDESESELNALFAVAVIANPKTGEGELTKSFTPVHAFLLLLMAAAALAQEAVVPDSSLSPHEPMQVACAKCHTASAWKPIRNKPDFDHSTTGYPLHGLHVAATCKDCHIDPVFADIGRNCQDCHADIHRRRNGAQCELCHTVGGWQVSLRNINEHQDRFPLIGAHAVADCYSCHRAGAVGEFNRQGLSTECVSCHLKAFQKTTSPNHQAMGFSTDCQQCHASFDSWIIAVSSPARRGRRALR
jgi:hypothetical protein